MQRDEVRDLADLLHVFGIIFKDVLSFADHVDDDVRRALQMLVSAVYVTYVTS